MVFFKDYVFPFFEDNSMKQHPVPQNIMSVEFKLFGEMTARQFAYIGGAGLFSWLLYLTPLPGAIVWPIIICLLLLALAFAFFPINDRPFDEWITNYIIAIMRPTRRVWKQSKFTPQFLEDQPLIASFKNDIAIDLDDSQPAAPSNYVYTDLEEKNVDMLERTKLRAIEEAKKHIENGEVDLTAQPAPVTRETIQAAGVQGIATKQVDNSTTPPLTSIPQPTPVIPNHPLGPLPDSPISRIQKHIHEELSYIPSHPTPESTVPPKQEANEPKEEKPQAEPLPQEQPAPAQPSPAQYVNMLQDTPPIPTPAAQTVPSKAADTMQHTEAVLDLPSPEPVTPAPLAQIDDITHLQQATPVAMQGPITSSDTPAASSTPPSDTTIPKGVSTIADEAVIFNPAALDMEAPVAKAPAPSSSIPIMTEPSQEQTAAPKPEEITLPAEEKKEDTIIEKIPGNDIPKVEPAPLIETPDASLQNAVSDILHKEEAPVSETVTPQDIVVAPIPPVTPEPLPVEKIPEVIVPDIPPSEPPVEAVQTLKEAPLIEDTQPPAVEPVDQKKKEEAEQLEKLREENDMLAHKLADLQEQLYVQNNITPTEEEKKQMQTTLPPFPDFINAPNMIHGIVLDKDDKVIPDVVIIIKDAMFKPVRAMRSTSLGQFYARSPLPNGVYKLELHKEQLLFKRISITLSGEKLEPIIARVITKEEAMTLTQGIPFNSFNSVSIPNGPDTEK